MADCVLILLKLELLPPLAAPPNKGLSLIEVGLDVGWDVGGVKRGKTVGPDVG